MKRIKKCVRKASATAILRGTTWSALDEIMISPFVSKVKLLPGAKRGKQPVWLSTVMRDYIQPTARKLGIQKKMSWHTFRHTFSSILKGDGEDVKVVQELLRHST